MTHDPKPKRKGNQLKRDYEVGKGKPPKHSQFPTGVSGNLSGRPKRPPKIYKTMSTQEALLLSLATKAMKGSVKDQLGVIDLIRNLEGSGPLDLNSLLDED